MIPNEDGLIRLRMRLLNIDENEGVDTIEVWKKINQIIFVLNELNITIYEHDKVAMEKWKTFMEENK
jgi:ArsR family metal-binding transcriptional regulator